MIYDINGNIITPNTVNGETLSKVFDIDGNELEVEKQKDPYLAGRLLLFEDDFDGDTLNEEIWGYELGNLRNQKRSILSKDSISVKNSCLVIDEIKCDYNGYSFKAGEVTTNGKIGWTFGRFEAKLKAPVSPLLSPAFWLMGLNHMVRNNDGIHDLDRPLITGCTPQPYAGELDIFEMFNDGRDRPASTVWTSKKETPHKALFYARTDYHVDPTQWHIYAVDLTDEYAIFTIDGREHGRMIMSDYTAEEVAAYKQPLHLLIGMDINTTTGTFEGDRQSCYVDWVRIYAPENITEKVYETSISMPASLELQVGGDYFIFPEFTPIETSDRRIKWFTDNPDVAYCEDGIVWALAPGVANITAASRTGKIAVCNVTVTGD